MLKDGRDLEKRREEWVKEKEGGREAIGGMVRYA